MQPAEGSWTRFDWQGARIRQNRQEPSANVKAFEMPKVYDDIEATLESADETLDHLMAEYVRSLQDRVVTGKAKRLTHNVCGQLRSALDITARRYWELHVKPTIPHQDGAKAKVYFPITKSPPAFDTMMGKWQWKSVRESHKAVEDFLRARQPFTGAHNEWLRIVDELSTSGKHIALIPQTRQEGRGLDVWSHDGKSRAAIGSGGVALSGAKLEVMPGGSIMISPAGAFFSGDVRVGSRIDPRTQRIEPTPGVSDRQSIWVSFIIKGYDVEASQFCRDACRNTRELIETMSDSFGLS